MNVVDVFNRIKDGYTELKAKIQRLRSLDETSEQYKQVKNSLLAIMFNGTFNERNKEVMRNLRQTETPILDGQEVH